MHLLLYVYKYIYTVYIYIYLCVFTYYLSVYIYIYLYAFVYLCLSVSVYCIHDMIMCLFICLLIYLLYLLVYLLNLFICSLWHTSSTYLYLIPLLSLMDISCPALPTLAAKAIKKSLVAVQPRCISGENQGSTMDIKGY